MKFKFGVLLQIVANYSKLLQNSCHKYSFVAAYQSAFELHSHPYNDFKDIDNTNIVNKRKEKQKIKEKFSIATVTHNYAAT